jgi:hypothetical protein
MTADSKHKGYFVRMYGASPLELLPMAMVHLLAIRESHDNQFAEALCGTTWLALLLREHVSKHVEHIICFQLMNSTAAVHAARSNFAMIVAESKIPMV